jgi:hypothetical protein
MMQKTKGEAYTSVMLFVTEVYWLAGYSKSAMHDSFLKGSEAWRRSRLRGWKAFCAYCEETHTKPADLFVLTRSDVFHANFVSWMEGKDTKEHIKKDATPALQHLLELAGTAQQYTTSVVRNLRRNTTTYVHRPSADLQIWDWCLFPQYARECQDPRTMP